MRNFNYPQFGKNYLFTISPIILFSIFVIVGILDNDRWTSDIRNVDPPDLSINFESENVSNSFAGIDYTDLGGRVVNNYQAWDPNPAVDDWVTGNFSHVAEGDVVAFSLDVFISSGDEGQNFEFTVCFDYDRSNNTTGPSVPPYAYIDLEAFNTTFSPNLRGSAINSTKDGASIDGDGIILNVFPLAQGVGADAGAAVTGKDQLCYEIEFTAPSSIGEYFIYVGAELAKAGATTEYGDVVGLGEGLSSWPVGTFQASLEQVTGNKTVNAQPGDIEVQVGPITKLVDTDADGIVELTGGVDIDTLLSGYTIVLCDDGTFPGDISCDTLVTDTTGQVIFTRLPGTYSFFEVDLPYNYEFVTWGDGITNVGGVNNQGTIVVTNNTAIT